ncbi:hypothetical protein K9N68_22925 [Kovacikia minuta CCNUW1]|uniref:hypothetical protein n=1 Tax=Kovacikia minuta TaxID=2931930 RepID=UPI001CCA1983|nr:hypothetical protein [Kovacikia minuta]UBF24524.1 hypothetical protein K9N68_22925 [Kovacikia minuta CCNUW1]
MRTIETTATVTTGGNLTVQIPYDITPGQHRIVLVINEQPVIKEKRQPLKFSAYPVGLVSSNFTCRREDLYGDR